MRDKFTGVGVALITPFNEDLSIDYPSLKKLLEHVMASDVDYLVVNGTTSEASTISNADKEAIFAFIKEHNTQGLPIMYGVGANDTNHVLETIKTMSFDGIDSILTVSPYYNKPSQEGIYQHYKIIADNSPVPVLLYNVPGRTSSNLSSSTTLRLAEHPNIFGIKEASGDLAQCIEIAHGKPDDFMLISGDDLLTIPMISVGCEGSISVLANAYPKEFTQMVHGGLKGKFTEVFNILGKFSTINDYMYTESNPVGIKEVLKNMGICNNNVRLPLLPASDELQTIIKEKFDLF
ncbi:MAG: 4-hydroxy-tetrahydrodipicolinate synthase [Cytophagales bacterium]|nr:4-hydroxy-tetrahydrodipicolinate synthase [Cytophagales bacterium]